MPKARTGSKCGPTITFRYTEEEQHMFDIICAIDERVRAEEFRYLMKRRFEEIRKQYTLVQMEAILKNKNLEMELNSKKGINELSELINEHKTAFSKLEKQTQDILKMRSGKDGEALSYQAIGKKVGLSRQRVQKIIEAAIETLKKDE